MNLSLFTTAELERLAEALSSGRLSSPVTDLGLQAEGLAEFEPLLGALNAPGAAVVTVAVQAVLAERRGHSSDPELVWTGPEERQSAARDTAVVLKDLFDLASRRVLLAGFAFDHGAKLLQPLHEAMRRGVEARLYADADVAQGFVAKHWPFGPPFPELFGFTPAPGVFASLHAKCVVVDGRWSFVTSANFTDRGQTRNIEVGVVLDSPSLAAALERQFSLGELFQPVG